MDASTLFPVTSFQAQRGDLWQLGDHLLLIGDAGVKEEIDRLFPGDMKAQAVITDPPYGEIQAKWDVATLAFIPHLKEVTTRECTAISFCSLPFGFSLHTAFLEAGWKFRFDAIWAKNNAGFQVSKQQPLPAHEYIFAYAPADTPATSLTFHGYQAGETLPSWGDRCKSTGISNQVYARGLASSRVGRPDGQRWIRSVLSGKKKQEIHPSLRTSHASQKPIELVRKLVLLVSNPGEIVYDCFLGSGTTLIAGEETGRRCFGIELYPSHGSEILSRWHKYTTREPVLLSSSKE